MPVFTQMRFLSTARINRIIGTLAAKLEIERPLVWLDRLNLVPAFNDELTGRFTGKVLAADLIVDDQRAVVQENMSLELVADTIPNIKIGQKLPQRLLDRLRQFEQQGTVSGENALRDWDMKIAENLLLSVRQRQNAIACAMMMDSFSYDRLGVKITGATWGMPANLKVTPSVAWGGNPTTATPLSDIWNIDQVARLAYGIEYDTVTMSTSDFRDMAATTEFAQRATLVIGAHFLLSSAALRTKNDPEMMKIAKQVLGKEIVLDDHTYNVRANDGTITTTRTLPLHKVVLHRSQDERDDSIWDMANGMPTESIVADMIGQGVGADLGGEQYGPIAYWTPASPDLNPPGAVCFAVVKSFPRKFVPESSAVLTVG
jgi:hypothetical protein